MALQPVFKRNYIEYLRTHIRPENYKNDHFDYDRSQVVRLYGIQQPDNLLDKLDPSDKGDYKSAVAVFEAYKDISPLFAQQDDIWIYLTHVDLFTYVQKRWPEAQTGGKSSSPEDYITDHWFRNRFNFLRTSIAGLWWDIYLTYDNERANPYELSEFLFRNQEFRTSSFGELPLIRHKEAAIGILEYLKDNEYLLSSSFNAKARFIRILFDIWGGYKNISYMSRDEFTKILYMNHELIESVRDVTEVKAGSEIYKKIKL